MGPARDSGNGATTGSLLPAVVRRGEGALLGQLVGDALGSVVEFSSATVVRREFPHGVRDIVASPVHRTLAGQPTDDSEMAFALADALVAGGAQGFDAGRVAAHYVQWWRSEPFDCGRTIGRACAAMREAERAGASLVETAQGADNGGSLANGAMMRQSVLGIWGWCLGLEPLLRAVAEDTRLTHPHPICVESSTVYVLALAGAIREGWDGPAAWRAALKWHRQYGREPRVRSSLEEARDAPPTDFGGLVTNALQNAFYQALHARDFETGLVETVSRGQDADTNGCIAGALLGAIGGVEAIGHAWRRTVLACRPGQGSPRPRPVVYWPGRGPTLANRLLESGQAVARRGIPISDVSDTDRI